MKKLLVAVVVSLTLLVFGMPASAVYDEALFSVEVTGPTEVPVNTSNTYHLTIYNEHGTEVYGTDFNRTLTVLGDRTVTKTANFDYEGTGYSLHGAYTVLVIDPDAEDSEEISDLDYTIGFTDPGSESGSDPEDQLVDFINSAHESIDIAVYSLRSWKVVNALKDAAARFGTDKVRVVCEYNSYTDPYSDNYFQALEAAGIEVITDMDGNNGSGLQHNKFVVVDNEKLWTGSVNFTYSGTHLNNNNYVCIASSQLAEIYTGEFEEMFVDKKFGTAKEDHTGYTATITVSADRVDINTASVAELTSLPGIGEVLAQRIVTYRNNNGSFGSVNDLDNVPGIGSAIMNKLSGLIDTTGTGTRDIGVEVYFSPTDNVRAHIIEQIEQAEESIYFATFYFTSDPIADALIAAAERGVKIIGVFEAENSEGYSVYQDLAANGKVDVRLDTNEELMHHKYFIIDEASVITGSYNLTGSAETRNDENILILHDPVAAGQFHEDFKNIILN